MEAKLEQYADYAKAFMNNMSAYTLAYDDTKTYQVSLLAKYLHKIPHYDVELVKVNSSFDPSNSHYLESVAIWTALPGFWLVLTLLLCLMFFLCQCCDISNNSERMDSLSLDGSPVLDAHGQQITNKLRKESKPSKSHGCSRFFLFILAILTILCVSAALYGCLQMQVGMYQVQTAMNHLSPIIDRIRNQSLEMDSSFSNLNKDANRLKETLGKHITNRHYVRLEEISKLTHNTNLEINRHVYDLNNGLQSVSLEVPRVSINIIEDVRKPFSILMVTLLMFINIILIYGVCCNSRCFLLMYSIFGLLAMIICWIACSIYLGFSIMAADFCSSPQPFLSSLSTSGRYVSAYDKTEPGIYNYYLYCRNNLDPNNPTATPPKTIVIVKELDDILTKALTESTNLNAQCATGNCERYDHIITSFINTIRKSKIDLGAITLQLGCQPTHKFYVDAMSGFCKTTFEGVIIKLVVVTLSGLLFTFLTLGSSQLWISIRKRRVVSSSKSYAMANHEIDPFLPSSNQSTTSRRNNLGMNHYGIATGSRSR